MNSSDALEQKWNDYSRTFCKIKLAVLLFVCFDWVPDHCRSEKYLAQAGFACWNCKAWCIKKCMYLNTFLATIIRDLKFFLRSSLWISNTSLTKLISLYSFDKYFFDFSLCERSIMTMLLNTAKHTASDKWFYVKLNRVVLDLSRVKQGGGSYFPTSYSLSRPFVYVQMYSM